MSEQNSSSRQLVADTEIVAAVGLMPARVYAVLLAHRGPDGTTVIAQERIAEAAGVCVRSVKTAGKALREAGLLKVEHRFVSRHRRLHSRYQFAGAKTRGRD